MKKITINLYTPKEVWKIFWNWAFWPRRKECSEWIDFAKGTIECDLEAVFKNCEDMIVQGFSDRLFRMCMGAINERLEQVKELMRKPN
jgi:hypothetical protein